jgi:tetratricopeptide (TPR) repeat protein
MHCKLPPSLQAASRLLARLPERSVALANLAATLTEQAVEHHRRLAEANPDAYFPDLAMALNNLGNRLLDLGRHDQALAPTQEALTTYRTLAKANPDAYLPDLASALNNLRSRLSDLGRHDQALAPTQEALTTYRTLAKANPDAHLPTLAAVLDNLGSRLSDLGRYKEAAKIQEEVASLVAWVTGDDEEDNGPASTEASPR